MSPRPWGDSHLRQVIWALGYQSEAAMDLGSIVAMEQLGHDLIAPLVHVLDNREWGPDPGERGIPIKLKG